MIRWLAVMGMLANILVSSTWAGPAEETLLAADREWAKAAASNDIEKVFTYWTDDAEIYAPGRPPAIGIDAIRQFVEQRRALPGSTISWDPQVAEVSESNDLGFTRGPYRMTLTGPDGQPAVMHGTYVSLWRRSAGGAWKCFLEIHSPLPRPEGPPKSAEP